MTTYKHTQPGGKLILTCCFVISVVFLSVLGWTLFRAPQNDKADFINIYIFIGVISLTTIIFALCVLMLSSLTVKIEDGKLKAIFGPGVFRKTIDLEKIESATPVKNTFGHGWGIHYYKGATVYNVAGWYAVELILKNGKRIRIGTDQPEELANAIKQLKQPQENK